MTQPKPTSPQKPTDNEELVRRVAERVWQMLREELRREQERKIPKGR